MGTSWAGRYTSPAGTRANQRTAVLFNCGGGVPASPLRAGLARYIAANGYPFLTYDYRGIGASRPASLRTLHAGVEDWSEFDCGGAIAYLRSSYRAAELVGMAHSLGALLIGGAPNVAEISRFVFIGAHTGYYKDYLRRYRLPMAVLWHGVMPIMTRAFGVISYAASCGLVRTSRQESQCSGLLDEAPIFVPRVHVMWTEHGP